MSTEDLSPMPTPTTEDPELYPGGVDALADDPGSIVAQYASDARILTTDKPYRNSYIARFQVRGGVITWFAEHFDPITLVEALGGTVTMPGQEVPA